MSISRDQAVLGFSAVAAAIHTIGSRCSSQQQLREGRTT